MRTIASLLLFVVVATSSEAQEREYLRVVPLFTNVGRGPAFMLTCENMSGEPVHAMDAYEAIAVWVDGQIVERRGAVTGSGPDRVMNPGESLNLAIVG